MAKKKILHIGNLQHFWSKAEAWITLNLESLFSQGEEFEAEINKLNSIVENNTIVIKDDEYSEDDILSVLNK